jgi:hypothetical protein
MSKHAILPQTGLPDDVLLQRLRFTLERELAKLRSSQRLAFEGRISAHYSATAPPVGGKWVAGDIVRNSIPAEAGGAGSMYVVTGWICTATGDPGTWVEMRTLTGA